MKRYIFPVLYLSLAAFISWFIALQIGLFELPDGFFYYVLGDYLLHGKLFTVYPYNASIPQTLYGPLYSIFLGFMIGKPFPWAITGIPFIQLLSTALSGLFVFYMAKLLIGKKWAVLAILVFFTLPFLFIYSTVLMSEAITLFWVTLWGFFLTLLIKNKTHLPPSLLVLIGSMLTLTKNAYVPIAILSIGLWIYFLWKKRHEMKVVSGLIQQIPFFIGLIGILLWMRFNKTHHNVYALTNYTGRHLYNNVVHLGRMLPDKDSDIYKQFLARVGVEENLYLIEYEVQRFFIPDFAAKKLTEQQVDQQFMAFSLAAIKKQPFYYFFHVPTVAAGDLTTAPYHAKILAALGRNDPTCPDCGIISCRFNWNGKMCTPQYPNPLAFTVWAGLLQFNSMMYPGWMIILSMLAFVGAIAAVIKKNIGILFLAGTFVFFLLIQAAAQQIEGRYVIPLYGLFTLCIVYGMRSIKALLRFHT